MLYRENHRPTASHWQTLSHNVVLSTLTKGLSWNWKFGKLFNHVTFFYWYFLFHLRIRFTFLFRITPVIWSDIFPVRWKNPGLSVAWCNEWLKSESKKPNLTDISSSCPCTSRQALRDVGSYHADLLCNSDYSNSATNCEFRDYHSSVSLCLRRNYNM